MATRIDMEFLEEIMKMVNYMLNSRGYEAFGIQKTSSFIKIYIQNKEQNNGNNTNM